MKILFAGSDRDLANLTSYALHRQGHHVIAAGDGREALQRWHAEHPDLVLLDAAMLPIDGFSVCRHIRQISSVPIIMFKGSGDEAELVRSYEAGADDCIVKPFSMRQLLIRIEVLMRRVNGPLGEHHGRGGGPSTLGDLVVDPAAFAASKNGVSVRLTRLEFRILHCLVDNAGTLVDAHRLADYAWQSPTGGDIGMLKTHISHLRQKLDDAGGLPVQIRAIPRTGYILSAATVEPRPAIPRASDGHHVHTGVRREVHLSSTTGST